MRKKTTAHCPEGWTHSGTISFYAVLPEGDAGVEGVAELALEARTLDETDMPATVHEVTESARAHSYYSVRRYSSSTSTN